MSDNKKTDILCFMADQHTPFYSGFYGYKNVDTPNLNRLCESGTTFNQCYTVCPLCGPARMSFLSAKRPAETGIFHKNILGDTTATFLHYLVSQGYETVLVGRMHFIGPDQYHGFTRHIAADMTPVTFNYMYSNAEMRKERGIYAQTDTFSGRGAASLAGGGTSPVLEYDRFVVDAAIEYLNQEHEKPQFIMVSIYGPHFPYVAPAELYKKYRNKVKVPAAFREEAGHSAIKHYQVCADEETALACQAAYCGMVEHTDALFGETWDAFNKFIKKRNTESAVMYFSDHGDQCGDRHIFGKETFYEKSVKIPFIMAGAGIDRGKKIETPVNIMDIGPTILDYTGSGKMYDVEGVSVAAALSGGEVPEHPVISEFMELPSGGFSFGPYDPSVKVSHGFMLRKDRYKYITYEGFEKEDQLFDIYDDPEEIHNLAGERSDVLKAMRDQAEHLLMHEKAYRNFVREAVANDLLSTYEWERHEADTSFRWNGASEAAGMYPEICVKNPDYFDENGNPVRKKKCRR